MTLRLVSGFTCLRLPCIFSPVNMVLIFPHRIDRRHPVMVLFVLRSCSLLCPLGALLMSFRACFTLYLFADSIPHCLRLYAAAITPHPSRGYFNICGSSERVMLGVFFTAVDFLLMLLLPCPVVRA